jgi:hypothetical protein
VEYAKIFIKDAKSAQRCDWCLRARLKNRFGLCRHCNEIRKRIAKLELAIRKSKPDFTLDWEFQVAKAERDDCKAWGGMLKSIFASVDSLDLEHWFSKLSGHIAADLDRHSASATTLGWTFDASQHQVLAYIFWEIFAQHASRNRRNNARYKPLHKKLNRR